MVSLEVGTDLFAVLSGRVGGGEFRCYNELVAIAALLHPFPDPSLGFFALVVVRAVEEVSSMEMLRGGKSDVSIKFPPCSKK